MTENGGQPEDDAGGTTRRSVLQSLGAVGGFGSVNEPGDSSIASLGLSDNGAKDVSLLQNTTWQLEHSDNNYYKPLGNDTIIHFETYSGLTYVGRQWSDYGNPSSNSDRRGAWKHTFSLFSYTMQVYEEPDSDGTDSSMNDCRVGNVILGDKIKTATVEVDTAEEAECTKDESEDITERDNVAVSLRRDPDLFNFLRPDAFEELGESEVDLIVGNDLDDCDGEWGGKTKVKKLLAGIGKPLRATFTNYEQRAQNIVAEREEEAAKRLISKVVQLGFWKLLGRTVCVGTAGCGAVATGLSLLSWAREETADKDPEITFARGFSKTYAPDPSSSEYFFPGLGSQIVFDVFVAPDEDKEGTFTVKSHYDIDIEIGMAAGYEWSPQWEIRVPGANPPSGDEETGRPADEYMPEPLPKGDDPDLENCEDHVTDPGRMTNVRLQWAAAEGKNTNPPAAAFCLSNDTPTPGEEIELNAEEAAEIAAERNISIDSYDWTIRKYSCERPPLTFKKYKRSGKITSYTPEYEGCYSVELEVVANESRMADTWHTRFEARNRDESEAAKELSGNSCEESSGSAFMGATGSVALGTTGSSSRGMKGILEATDLRKARNLWATEGTTIPGTDGKEMDSDTLQTLTAEYNEDWNLFQVETEWGVKDE